jgi:hypothetical protein
VPGKILMAYPLPRINRVGELPGILSQFSGKCKPVPLFSPEKTIVFRTHIRSSPQSAGVRRLVGGGLGLIGCPCSPSITKVSKIIWD